MNITFKSVFLFYFFIIIFYIEDICGSNSLYHK